MRLGGSAGDMHVDNNSFLNSACVCPVFLLPQTLIDGLLRNISEAILKPFETFAFSTFFNKIEKKMLHFIVRMSG